MAIYQVPKKKSTILEWLKKLSARKPKQRKCINCKYEPDITCWGLRNLEDDKIDTLVGDETLAVICKEYQRKRFRFWAAK